MIFLYYLFVVVQLYAVYVMLRAITREQMKNGLNIIYGQWRCFLIFYIPMLTYQLVFFFAMEITEEVEEERITFVKYLIASYYIISLGLAILDVISVVKAI